MIEEGPLFPGPRKSHEPDQIDETLSAAHMYECAKICQLSGRKLLKASRYLSELLIEADDEPTAEIIDFPRLRRVR